MLLLLLLFIIIIVVVVVVVVIAAVAFGTTAKGLLKGLEVGGQVETIQMTALLRTARILRQVLETCCHSNSSEKPSANTDMKNSKGVNSKSILVNFCKLRDMQN